MFTRWVIITSVVLISGLAESQTFDIYTVDVKTGAVVQVTSVDPGDEFNPSWSNNGKQIAHDVVGGAAPLGHSIYITDVATGVSTLLTGAEGGNDAAWSPNGQKIAFDRIPGGDNNIYVLPPTGGTPALVRTDAVDPSWSPNSKRLAFQQPSDGSIRTMDENGGSETFVTYGQAPVWSPNGQWIAYSDGNHVFKIRVNMFGEPLGSPIQLTFPPNGPVFENQLSWSNNSMTIAFHTNRGGADFDIWTVPASGGTPTPLTGFADTHDYDPAYSNNGRLVAFAGVTGISAAKRGPSNLDGAPSQFSLSQNYPNPFNPETVIRFELSEPGDLTIRVFNALGEEVRTLVSGYYQAGEYTVLWDGRDENGQAVSSGIYLYQLRAADIVEVRKMVVVR